MRKRSIFACSAFAFALFIGGSIVSAESPTLSSPSATTQSQLSFSDVPTTHWAYSTILWGASNNIATGYSDGTFKPSNTVTEEEFLALLIRAFKSDVSTATTGKWSDPYYEVAKTNNYPVSSKRTATINRQSVAEIVVGTQGKNYTGNDAIQYMLGMGLANGKTSATIGGYAGKDVLTRAEALQFIKNVLDNAESKELLPRPTTTSPKDELPELPTVPVDVVGKMDEKLAKQASDVQSAIMDTGYKVSYNGDRGSITIKDANSKTIMSYTDSTSKGEGRTITVVVDNMADSSNTKLDQKKVNAIIIALQTLGLSVDSKLSAAMYNVIYEGDPDASLIYSGFTLSLVGTGFGKAAMYVEYV